MLPSREEVKEAIKSLTPVDCITKDGTGLLNRKALDTALSVLQAYLNAPVVEERICHKTPILACYTCYQVEGFNEALRLDRVEWMRKCQECKEKNDLSLENIRLL